MVHLLQRFRGVALTLLLASGGLAAQGNSEFESITLPVLDMSKIANEDAIGDVKGNQGGYRFAIGREVNVAPGRNGGKHQLATGGG